MSNKKQPFESDYHSVTENIKREQNVLTRVRLYKALLGTPEFSSTPYAFAANEYNQGVSQKLSFIPDLKSGWGPSNSDIEDAARKLAGGYMAHLQVFTAEGFPDPSAAAIAALKEYDFEI